MLKQHHLQQLAELKSYIRAEQASKAKWTNPKNMVRLANYPSQLNPDSKLAKYAPQPRLVSSAYSEFMVWSLRHAVKRI